jgi:hypothetical protein
MEVILLNGEYGTTRAIHGPHDCECFHDKMIAAGATCDNDELVEVLTDRKHDRVELRKAHYIASIATVSITYAIAVEKD